MQNDYKILGLEEGASVEEVEKAYRKLKDRYSRERFYEGEIGNEAARNLTKLETAYAEIMSEISRTKKSETGTTADFMEIEKLIKDGQLEKAQSKLDEYSDRDAQWHYLQSIIFYKKNWTNESKKQLEIALTLEPNNPTYQDSYAKLKKRMEFTENQFKSGNANPGMNPGSSDAPNKEQMGMNGCSTCSDCCTVYCCTRCLCDMCSGGC